MKAAVFDTCIIIDYVRGIEQARETISACPLRLISSITLIEFLAGVPLDRMQKAEFFLEDNFEILPLDTDVAKQSIVIRKNYKMKLPDAIIYGTAKNEKFPLVTRNVKDFNPEWPDISIPYKI